MNQIHQQGSCCGYRGGNDFIHSRWMVVQYESSLRPFSCCSSQTASCSTLLSTYLGDTGCHQTVIDTIIYFYWSLLGVSFSSLAIQLTLMGVSLLMTACCIWWNHIQCISITLHFWEGDILTSLFYYSSTSSIS